MWKHLGTLPRRIVLSAAFASSLATAAFAFNETVYAKSTRCCLFITTCFGDPCGGDDDCSEALGGDGGFCCPNCVESQ